MKVKIKLSAEQVRDFLIKGRIMLAKYDELIETGKNPDDAFEEIDLVGDVKRIKKEVK